MAPDTKSKTNHANADAKGKKRKQYLPYNKPVKKKGYPLRPGVQGFFITCDGGRERQAAREAINVIESFYEELAHGNDTTTDTGNPSSQPTNKKIKFTYSESSSDEEDESSSDEGEEEEESKSDVCVEREANHENAEDEPSDPSKINEASNGDQIVKPEVDGNENGKSLDKVNEASEPPAKKQCLDSDSSRSLVVGKKEEKSIDKLIEAELEELADKSKRHFVNLDSGCNGVVFVQMRKHDGGPGPREIVQHMMTTAASTRKHMSRFILRVLPIEVACYASEEEISKAIKPLVEQYFPIETENPQKVL